MKNEHLEECYVDTYCIATVWKLQALQVVWLCVGLQSILWLIICALYYPIYDSDQSEEKKLCDIDKFIAWEKMFMRIIPVLLTTTTLISFAFIEETSIWFIIYAQRGIDTEEMMFDLDNPPMVATEEQDAIFGDGLKVIEDGNVMYR